MKALHAKGNSMADAVIWQAEDCFVAAKAIIGSIQCWPLYGEWIRRFANLALGWPGGQPGQVAGLHAWLERPCGPGAPSQALQACARALPV